ncbi:MAG: aspartate 1-decarboxylase [Spirochaetales bacterium]|nr:aspartate 1-decarboxylase [Spirochaetales bacterium]MBR6201325.1 aspartate 1-decarboxylase [Spirochaetales bacterium]
MLVNMMKSKIHRATVTEAVLAYEGSITVDQDLLDAAKMFEHERVQVLNMSNGSRLETYTIAGPRGSGVICLNGPAARLGYPGDEVVIVAYALMDEKEAAAHKPTVVLVDKQNKKR